MPVPIVSAVAWQAREPPARGGRRRGACTNREALVAAQAQEPPARGGRRRGDCSNREALVACQAREPPAQGGRRRGDCSDRKTALNKLSCSPLYQLLSRAAQESGTFETQLHLTQ